jgi:hypothetical protein
MDDRIVKSITRLVIPFIQLYGFSLFYMDISHQVVVFRVEHLGTS